MNPLPSRRTRPAWKPLALGFLLAFAGSLPLTLGAVGLAAAQTAVAGVGAAPMSLKDAYLHARQNDPTFRAAGFELDAAREAIPIARASLLPAVGFSASTSEVEGWRKARNQLNQDTRVRLDYVSPQASIQMRMPLLNREAAARVDLAQIQVQAAESAYAGRGVELVDRLLVAYMTLLLVEETAAQNRRQLAALEQQAVQARNRLERGEGTRLDVTRTQAEVDVSQARVLDLDFQIRTARRDLQRLTGVEVTRVRAVPSDLPLGSLTPESLFTWLEMAERMNPSIRLRQQQVVAAQVDVQRNRAGHLPRLDLVASVSQAQNESVSNLGQTTTLKSLGLQFSVPLYSGGATQASVRQALSDQARAEEELRAQREGVALEIQRQHQGLLAGIERLAAQARAVSSAQLAVEGSQRALAAGFGTTAEVTDALARLATAQRDLAQIRIELLLSRARLMLQAGLPLMEVIDDVDRVMAAAPTPSEPSSPTPGARN
jgi:outer membrane protein, protease secretion system